MKMIDQIHLRVIDKGLFLPVARRLAREVSRVSYWTPWEKAFPVVTDCLGDGFADIERVDCFLADLNTVDGFVFPDVGFAALQQHLVELGFPVWGARAADELETSRGTFLDTLRQTQLPVPKHEKIVGLTALHEFLADKQDRWIKISRFRGDWETFHWRSQAEDENELDYYAVRLGPFREHIAFYVFEPIEARIEDGCDTWCIDGQFPALILHGMEAKDKAFIGAFQKFADLPAEVRIVNEEFGPVLAKYGYRSFFSSEVRITDDGESYFIDPTCRAGSPPSQIMTEMIGNYAEMIWGGSNGQLVEPEPAAQFGVQALCKFKRDEHCWNYVALDPELDQWLKCSHTLLDAEHRQLALPPGNVTGCEDWLIGVGDTMAEAIHHLQANAKLLPEGASCDISPIAEVLTEIQEAEQQGMEFTDQPVPDPEIVVES